VLSESDARSAQALADIATVSILQLRALRSSRELADQLQAALESRVVIEQAKGVLSAAGTLDMEEAFARLRQYARNRNLRLPLVAASVANRALSADEVLSYRR
jgi:AmiR/NasT family two-component response regulator